MDHHATITAAAPAVFAHLAAPERLGDWLPQVVRVDARSAPLIGLGSAFTVTLRVAGDEQDVDAEVIAHEPPWLIAYRFLTASPLLIRITCTVHAEGTAVHVHHTDDALPLVIDLTRLGWSLNGTADRALIPPGV